MTDQEKAESNDLSMEEYKKLVESLGLEIESVVMTEEGRVVVGTQDALTQVLANVLRATIQAENSPKEVVSNLMTKTVSWLASQCSQEFEEKFGETLFGLESHKK